MTPDNFDERLRAAMWAGDVDALQEIAPCACCCGEHTWPTCEARLWGGCRSGHPYGWGPEDDYEYERSWMRHYATAHGMSEAEFYGRDTTEEE